jgi:para-aminobenzoate synthetase component 1
VAGVVGAQEPIAVLGGKVATDLVEVSHDPSALDRPGWWAVVATYEGDFTCARFATVNDAAEIPSGRWIGPAVDAWTTSMDEHVYIGAVEATRAAIARGDVYQANICRVLAAQLPDASAADVLGLHALLAKGNPAPYGGVIRLPDHGVHVATASPELFLRKFGRRVWSGPIKGTGATTADLQPKDTAENVMIVDLVRNDLSRVAVTGSVAVPSLLGVEEHPGLVHLVSLVSADLRDDVGWTELFAATFPPGSVTGAPKSSAVTLIAELETARRGPYCGAIGWVDARRGIAELAVGIRTFWLEGEVVKFGTGAGITWGSGAPDEWSETQLKARRLLDVASGTWPDSTWQG